MSTSHELIWKLIDRTITAQEFNELQQLLLENAELRKTYQDCLETDFSLQQLTDHTAMSDNAGSFPQKKSSFLRMSWLAAGLIAACLLLFTILRDHSGGEEPPKANQVALTSGPFTFTPWVSGLTASREIGLAGEIRNRALQAVTITATGAEAADCLAPPHPLPCGVLELAAGWMELSFEGSAIVRLNGPVTFEILSNSSGYLFNGSLTVTDDGPGDHFTVFHDQGKVVDIGTAFAMRVEKGKDLNVYVQEGLVDLYDGVELSLDRLKEGDYFSSRGKDLPAITRLPAPPKWVGQASREPHNEVPASQTTQGQSTLQTTTWLRGIKGSGQAAGNLAGVGAEVTSDPCHNSGELIPMNWSQALDQLSPARVWYHPESASIGAINAMNSDPRRCPVTVKLQGKVRDPILLFSWGEKDLQVDLSGNTIREKSTLVAHHSITLQKNLLDFGDDPSRDNIPRQAAAVQLEGLFGPENPIRFHLINRGDIPKTLTFSLGIEGD